MYIYIYDAYLCIYIYVYIYMMCIYVYIDECACIYHSWHMIDNQPFCENLLLQPRTTEEFNLI